MRIASCYVFYCRTTLAGTAFRADTDISSLFSFCFFSVLFLVRPRKRTKKNGAVRHGGRWGKRASTREAALSVPLRNYGLHLVTYSIVGQPLLEQRAGQTQTFPLSLAFVFSSSFFLYAQEKGPKRTAPFGTGPVGKRASTREAALSDPLTNYGLHRVTYSNGWTTLAGTACRADIGISYHQTSFLLLRPFSCTPKKKDQKERRRSARGPVGKRASTREAALSDPLTNYGLHLVTYSNGWTTLAGTVFRADTDFSSLFSFCFFFVLFLVRPRKRTKKNGAVRHGAGFSTNCCNGNSRVGAC